ncbi:MAG: hypothetical protein ACLU0O_09450 [Collinsella sp.]
MPCTRGWQRWPLAWSEVQVRAVPRRAPAAASSAVRGRRRRGGRDHCQAAGVAHADLQVDTVFEIGGQDSKFISLAGGQVSTFR